MAGNPTAIWTDCLQQTQAVIQALGLQYGPGTLLPSTQVYLFKQPSDRGITLPCVQVCPGGKERLDGSVFGQGGPGDFEDTAFSLPILVLTMFAADKSVVVNNDPFYWRQLIVEKFIDQPRPEVTTADVADCRIDPDPFLNEPFFQQANMDVAGLMLWFRAAVTRGRQ